MKNIKLKIIVLVLVSFFAHTAFAARIFVSDNVETFMPGRGFYIDILLDTKGESINAVKGDILYPEDLLTFIRTSDNQSVMSSWVDPIRPSGNSISFSGIIFNGFTGVIDPLTQQKKPGVLMRVYFMPTHEASGIILLTDLVAYKNDGNGTAIKLKDESLAFVIGPNGQSQVTEPVDTIPPEEFIPAIMNSAEMYEGQYVLVFSTIDKQSGMDHYEVKEGNGPWVTTESPYLLQDQSLRSQIQVKALDRAGNERIATVEKPKPFPYVIVFFVLLLLLLLFLLTRHKKTIGRKN